MWIAFTVILIVAFLQFVSPFPQYRQSAPFVGHVDAYTRYDVALGEPASSGSPYIAGKAIVVRVGNSYAHNVNSAKTDGSLGDEGSVSEDPHDSPFSFIGELLEDAFGNSADHSIDDLHYGLSDRIRAREPSEVGTVILLGWERREAAVYTDGSVAEAYSVVLTVVDLHRDRVVGARTFEGSDPPRSKYRNSGDVDGSMPFDAVRRYIASLPVRPPVRDR